MDKNNYIYIITLTNGEYVNVQGSRSICDLDNNILQIFAFVEQDDGTEKEQNKACFMMNNIAGYIINKI